MKIREWVNDNSALATLVAVVVLIGALAYLVMSNTSAGGRGPRLQWFYDLKTGELIERSIGEMAPVDTESGKEQGVKAIVYSCTDCGSDPQIAWIEKFSAKAKKKLEALQRKHEEAGGKAGGPPAGLMMHPEMMDLSMGKLISRADPIKWYRLSQEKGRKIQAEIRNVCGEGVKIQFCYPDK